MFNHILVPIDFSAQAMKAVEVATDLAKQVNAKVELLNIITIGIAVKKNQAGGYESIKDSAKDFIAQVLTTAQERLDQFKEAVSHKAVEIETRVLVEEDSKNLVEMIMSTNTDLIVVSGRRKHQLSEIFDIPIREKVIQLANCPILIVNEQVQKFQISKMVFATQFHQKITHAVNTIKSLQQLFQAESHLLYVNTPNRFKTTLEINAQANEFKTKYGLQDFKLSIYNDRKAEDGIMRFSEDMNADLTIVCTNGSTWMTRLFQGHIANEVVNESIKPVLIFNIARFKK